VGPPLAAPAASRGVKPRGRRPLLTTRFAQHTPGHELISSDAKACHGKFASGRSNELVDDDVVFYALTSCGDTQGERAVQYFVTPWRKTGFAIFAVAKTPGSQDQEEPSSSTKVDMFKKAALGAAR
jgi:hypothetical protein